jgi:hypothetical protein
MAKAIDWNPFGPWSGTLSWAELFDGRVWEIRKGEDFDLAASTIVERIRAEHARVYGELLVKVDGDVVRVQRVPGIGDVKAAAA